MSDWPLHEDGTWREVPARHGGSVGPGLFLDRDGVIVEETGYLRKVEDVRLTDGIADVIARANARGIPVVVVTNQSGIGHGIFGWNDFVAVQHEIAIRLCEAGARWDAVYASPFPPGNSAMRKPRPGMLLAAAEALGLDLASSWIVGDRETDIEAGLNAGLAGGLMVGDGYSDGERLRAAGLAVHGRFTVHVIASPREAASLLPFLRIP